MTSTPTAKAGRILIVDDDHEVHTLYRPALVEAGYDTFEAYSSSEAIELVRKKRPHLIIMDRRLPDGDGWELTRILKGMASTARTPIIALTGMTLRAEVERALHAGCDAFLSKPCTPDALLIQVRKLLELMPATPTPTNFRFPPRDGEG